MRISTKKVTSDVLSLLTPGERVALILEYQKQRYLTGESYEKEIEQVQTEMLDEQKNEYAETALAVMFANRILFDYILLVANEFYRLLNVFFLELLEISLTPAEIHKNPNDIFKPHYQKLLEIYKQLLTCKNVASTISNQIGIKDIIYPQYLSYFQRIDKRLEFILKLFAQKTMPSQSNQEIHDLLVNRISEAVNSRFI